MFGAALSLDLTYTGELFDTPAMPRRCIEYSRRLTAAAFGARYSAYVTTGTTTSNLISVFALCREGDRVLVDRRCHQSIHFALTKVRARVTYAASLPRDEASNRSAIDVEALVHQCQLASRQRDAYRVIVLSNCSYEGVIHDMGALMSACLEIDPEVRFIVDEAWFALNYFHPLYRPYTAMHAAKSAATVASSLVVVATQSAHKSLSALRQGSYIHVHGDPKSIQAVREAQYAYHTTSPSYPILASLELARAQAVVEGPSRIRTLLWEARRLRRAVESEPLLAGYRINGSPGLLSRYVFVDPLRVSLNVSQLAPDPRGFNSFLLKRHGIYVNCYTDSSVLFNIHIGLSSSSIDRLLEALADFARTRKPHRQRPRKAQVQPELEPAAEPPPEGSGCIADRYLIPYPPGVPWVVPGEVVTPHIEQGLDRLRNAGIEVLSIHPNEFLGAPAVPAIPVIKES